MTEAEWLASNDPRAMIWGLRDLLNLRSKRKARKLRLFGVACCNRIRHLLELPGASRAVDLAEQYTDGQVSEEEMLAASELVAHMHSGVWDAYQAARKASSKSPTYTFRRAYWDGPDYAAACAVWRSTLWEQVKVAPDPPKQEKPNAVASAAKGAERVVQAGILRDVFGNPFREVKFDKTWLTVNVVALAKQIYESRDFGAMPVLADALEDAGCMEANILSHLRSPGPHVKGCWAVDLILGRG